MFTFQIPQTKEDWLKISKQFEELWNFPNCIGALDGKHIIITKPNNSGSFFFNYKEQHSVVLMALVDANYKFIYIDINCSGYISDGGEFANSSLASALSGNRLNIPEPRPLASRIKAVPYILVADEPFPLRTYIMKPYPFINQTCAPHQVFNYRLSRARKMVENAFGILANRFQILRKPISLKVENVSSIVKSITALHNFLMSRMDSRRIYASDEFLDSNNEENGTWRLEGMPKHNFLPLQNEYFCSELSNQAQEIRSEFTDYFMNEGKMD